MGSDWEYGRENGFWGDDGIPYSVYDVDEDKEWDVIAALGARGYMTVDKWNEVGRKVKKGENGATRINMFSESQTTTIGDSGSKDVSEAKIEIHFETYGEAVSWAKENAGKTITRSPDGNGFITKK